MYLPFTIFQSFDKKNNVGQNLSMSPSDYYRAAMSGKPVPSDLPYNPDVQGDASNSDEIPFERMRGVELEDLDIKHREVVERQQRVNKDISARHKADREFRKRLEERTKDGQSN